MQFTHEPHRILSNDIELVAALISSGADPNAPVGGDVEDVRPLAVHAFSGHYEIVQLLLANGADPDLGRVATGETPLHHACLDDDPTQFDIVSALLAAGADPNRKCTSGVLSVNFMRDVRVRGETPLHRAAAYAEERTIRALIAAGSTVDEKDAIGDSPLTWASMHDREVEVLRLVCYGGIRV